MGQRVDRWRNECMSLIWLEAKDSITAPWRSKFTPKKVPFTPKVFDVIFQIAWDVVKAKPHFLWFTTRISVSVRKVLFTSKQGDATKLHILFANWIYQYEGLYSCFPLLKSMLCPKDDIRRSFIRKLADEYETYVNSSKVSCNPRPSYPITAQSI